MKSGTRRPLAAMLWLLPLPFCLGVISLLQHLDASAVPGETAAVRAVTRKLPSSDFAMFGSSRWLRSPSLEEPGAAHADEPAMPDVDPAGGLVRPPRELWRQTDGRSGGAH